jgi:hypothetical protein
MAARTSSPWVVLVALTGLVASVITAGAGCVTGATPDCSSPDTGCGPGAEGGPLQPDAEGGVSADAPGVDTGVDSGVDSGADVQQPGVDASDAAPDVTEASSGDGATD